MIPLIKKYSTNTYFPSWENIMDKNFLYQSLDRLSLHTNRESTKYKYLIGKKEVGQKWLNFLPLTKISNSLFSIVIIGDWLNFRPTKNQADYFLDRLFFYREGMSQARPSGVTGTYFWTRMCQFSLTKYHAWYLPCSLYAER